MYIFVVIAALEPRHQKQSIAGIRADRCRATQHRLHVIERIVALPRELVRSLPFLFRHAGVWHAHVIEVVLVQVRIERGADTKELEMVLRSRQRR